jgi:hypothetical protein
MYRCLQLRYVCSVGCTNQRRTEGGWGFKSPPSEIPKFLQSPSEFPVPWKPGRNTGFTHLQIEWNPRLGGYRPQIHVFSALCLQLNLLNTPEKKMLGAPLVPSRLMKPTVFVFTHEVYIFIIFLSVNETRRFSIHVLWVLLDNEFYATENAPIQSGLFYKVMQFLLLRHNPNRA